MLRCSKPTHTMATTAQPPARAQRKSRAASRKQRREERHHAIKWYLDTIDTQVACYGAQDIPASLRAIMEREMVSHVPRTVEDITAPYADTLCTRHIGYMD